MSFKEFLNEAKKKTVSIQVTDVDKVVTFFRGTDIEAKPHPKLDDEVVLTYDAKYTKDVVKVLGKMGFDKEDLEDMYPEIFE